jgi:hypothetical protein
MLERTDIVYIKHFNDACKIFGTSVDIKGGVNYFLKDTDHNGDCKFNGSITKLNKDLILQSHITRKYQVTKINRINDKAFILFLIVDCILFFKDQNEDRNKKEKKSQTVFVSRCGKHDSKVEMVFVSSV